MPKISIITPAYNCEKYLEQSVDSVLSQTWQDWELLIIDDCSKDNTYALMQELAKKDEFYSIYWSEYNFVKENGSSELREMPDYLNQDRPSFEARA